MKHSLGNCRVAHSSTGTQPPSQYMQERAGELAVAPANVSRSQGQELRKAMITIDAARTKEE
jgi:hypothetical protein